ncbi:MAG TPA: glycine oxidase ThiO [Actinomycetota bacterium]|nr:glycine oxidase ThiO [Actinomycetota bacterium]
MRYDCVIVGAGIIGLSIGWRASQYGLSVLVLDRADPPDGASAVAAGMLAPVTEANFGEESLLRLNLEGAHRWPAFAEELSFAAGMHLNDHEKGILHVALDRDQAEALHRLFDYQTALGLDVEWLSSLACRRMEPGLHPSTRSGILARADAAVDPRRIVEALRVVLRAAGGQVRHGAEVVEVKGNPDTGVRLAGGEQIPADNVVLAAGCWSGRIPGVPEHFSRALRPVKGQILRLRPSPAQPPLRLVLRTEEVYVVPRPGGEVVVGATVEEKGFDTTATAGGVLELLRAGNELLPGIREMAVAEVGAGLRPGTPDNAPILGELAPGIVAATGHYRNGILLAPLTADGIAELLAKGELPEELAGFAPDRFDL